MTQPAALSTAIVSASGPVNVLRLLARFAARIRYMSLPLIVAGRIDRQSRRLKRLKLSDCYQLSISDMTSGGSSRLNHACPYLYGSPLYR